jgi:hypothetical protein
MFRSFLAAGVAPCAFANNGYTSLFKMPLDGSGKETLALGYNGADIDNVIEAATSAWSARATRQRSATSNTSIPSSGSFRSIWPGRSASTAK